MKTYKANVLVNLPLALMPLMLLIPLYEQGFESNTGFIGFTILSAIAALIILVPFGLRLKVSNSSIETSFLGITLTEITASNVESVQYRNLLLGGLGIGKGLIIRTKSGKRVSIGEKMYGKESINDVKSSLV